MGNSRNIMKKYDKCECEILNGDIVGIEKGYFENGNLMHEDERYNNKENGKIKVYYENSVLRFEYEYVNRDKKGKGKKYDEEGYLIYEGEFLITMQMELEKNMIKKEM